MKYAIEKYDNFVVIEPMSEVLKGEEAIQLKVEFLLRNNTGHKNIVLDLQHVRQIDESGVRMGVLANRLCKAVGGVFILIEVCEEIYEFLRMCRIEKSFIIRNNVEQAKRFIYHKDGGNHNKGAFL